MNSARKEELKFIDFVALEKRRAQELEEKIVDLFECGFPLGDVARLTGADPQRLKELWIDDVFEKFAAIRKKGGTMD